MLGAPQSSTKVIKVPKFKLEGDGVFRVPAATNEEMSSIIVNRAPHARRLQSPGILSQIGIRRQIIVMCILPVDTFVKGIVSFVRISWLRSSRAYEGGGRPRRNKWSDIVHYAMQPRFVVQDG
jgi:hypothetical protein